MAKILFLCPQCKQEVPCEISRINQAKRKGLPVYCGRNCSGVARRKENPIGPRNPNWKELKSAYDRKRRTEKREEIRAKKKAAYAAWGPKNREKERETRKARMHLHVEYRRRPEYRAQKVVYDRRRRAKLQFGGFAEAFLAVQELDREIASRMDNYELAVAKGTVNKSIQRRRDYERSTGNIKANRKQPQGFPLGHPQQNQVGQHAASAG